MQPSEPVIKRLTSNENPEKEPEVQVNWIKLIRNLTSYYSSWKEMSQVGVKVTFWFLFESSPPKVNNKDVSAFWTLLSIFGAFEKVCVCTVSRSETYRNWNSMRRCFFIVYFIAFGIFKMLTIKLTITVNYDKAAFTVY